MTLTARQAFMTVHEGLPRQAPGDEDSSARALAATGINPTAVLDLGCGPGAGMLQLARLLPDRPTAERPGSPRRHFPAPGLVPAPRPDCQSPIAVSKLRDLFYRTTGLFSLHP